MRNFVVALVSVSGLLLGSARSWAQGPPLVMEPPQVGFRSYASEREFHYKVGLWAPVLVPLNAGPKGFGGGQLVIEAPDSEDVGTVFTAQVPPLDKKERRYALAYVNAGNTGDSIRATLRTGDGNFSPAGLL